MSIDLEAIEARAKAAAPGPWSQKPNPFACAPEITNGERDIAKVLLWMGSEDCEAFKNADFIAHAREDIPALLAEVRRQAAEIASVTAERDALKEALELMAEYIVTLGGVDYHLCDVIPQEHHLKYQPKNDGDYDNEPCIECVKAYFMSKAGKEQNNG